MRAICTVCGTHVSWSGCTDSNAVCLDCLPNLAASIDRRALPEALALDMESVEQLMAEEDEGL